MNMHVQSAAVTSGVQGHSSPSTYDSYIIFCVGNDIARESAFRAWAAAHSIGFKNMLGCYKGVSERSFIVNAVNAEACEPWYKDEESILHLGPLYRDGKLYGAREATLVMQSGLRIELGWMQDVPKGIALARDEWTYDPQEDLYWVTKGRNPA